MTDLELIRYKLNLEAQRARLDKDLVFETIFVAQEMHMTVDGVLELDIEVYNAIVEYLREKYEKIAEANQINKPITFGWW